MTVVGCFTEQAETGRNQVARPRSHRRFSHPGHRAVHKIERQGLHRASGLERRTRPEKARAGGCGDCGGWLPVRGGRRVAVDCRLYRLLIWCFLCPGGTVVDAPEFRV